ncbi:MAG: tRNA (adenosine(37)-N6)-dimethylallyltransferase MiaA [Propionibacteriaceae bacterium]|nr:tRNA (adenosine(37)-N6)-dimethylallyltransferase MiaA [Propionibacteriaceae bacterium]
MPGILALNGPTASGKSTLAVDIAVALAWRGQGAEIVNADAMLVYRGMDIGTAKPTVAERRGVRHHLLDILDVTQTATVAQFQARARAAIADCRARGVLPIVVGGSALYMRAILDHFDFPGTDATVRARWEAELARVGPEALHAVLAERAPGTAAEIQPGNGRRTVRALEVLELTGGHAPNLPEWTYALEGVTSIGLDLDRATMDARIIDRVDAMWAAGLVDEVRGLERRGLRDGVTAVKAIGYRQVLQYLDGDLTEDEARAAVVKATKRFARRQLSWFRRDHRIDWRDATTPGLATAIADHLAQDPR